VSNGSVDNLAKLATGECDLAFVQDDTSAVSGLVKIVTPNQMEGAFLVCPVPSGIKTLDDLTDKVTILVGSDQTGSQFTLRKLVELGTPLAKAKIDATQTTSEVANFLANDKSSTCLFAVSTPNAGFLKNLDQGPWHQLVAMFNSHFPKGHDGYTPVRIGRNHFKNLTQKLYDNVWDDGTDSVAVKTSLVAPQSWVDQNHDLFNLLMMEKINLQTSLQ
jgi:TRAP-type uncharacterized transport system substrate-binding protein